MFQPSSPIVYNSLPPVIVYGNPGVDRPGLQQIAQAVPADFPLQDTATQLGLQSIIQQMVDLLATAKGGGLAAPQVGLSITLPPSEQTPPPSIMLRLFIIPWQGNNYQEFINPVITFPDNTSFAPQNLQPSGCDGCLSVPDPTGDSLERSTFRPGAVTITYYTIDSFPNGTPTTQTFTYNNQQCTPAVSTFVVPPNAEAWFLIQHEMDHLDGKLYYNYCDANDSIYQALTQISAANFPAPSYPTYPAGYASSSVQAVAHKAVETDA